MNKKLIIYYMAETKVPPVSCVIPYRFLVTIMSLHLFSGPGWLDAACAEASHATNWAAALNPANATRGSMTIRAELPPIRVEGQTEKRWRGAPIL